MSSEFVIPQNVQDLIFKCLAALQHGALRASASMLWLSQWAAVIGIGALLGLCLYALLLAAASTGIKVALAKAGLYKPPEVKTKAERSKRERAHDPGRGHGPGL